MTRNLNYLIELLESIQAATVPIDDLDTSISDNWKEVFSTIESWHELPVTPEATPGVQGVVKKFNEMMVRKHPKAELVADPLVGDSAIVFKTPQSSINLVTIHSE